MNRHNCDNMSTLFAILAVLTPASPITLQVCNDLVNQKFSMIDIPSNLPPNKGSFQLSQQPFINSGCANWSTTSTNCIVNVEAWGTTVGDVVWVKDVASTEPVKDELNRVWQLTNDGSFLNPTSSLCADAKDGTSAPPGAPLVLTKCGDKQSSSWVFSTVDGTVSQKSRAGGFPGLCLTVELPAPPPPPPGPLPPLLNISLTIPDTSNSTTSATMVSFNFDWHENTEEPPYWDNASAMIMNLNSPMLREAAKAMSPAILRLGGSEGDVVCYDVPTHNSTCASMNQTDPLMCLSMQRYKELSDFVSESGLKFVFGLNAVWGRLNHSLTNPLDLTNIEALLAYTVENNISIYGFEVGNEKCGPPPALFAKDYHNVHDLLLKYWPDKATRPLLIGNDCNTNPKYLQEFLPLVSDILDVTTYHHYDGYGLDPHIAAKIMTPAFLDGTVSAELNAVHAQYAPNSQLWVGEAAAAWHSGAIGVTDAFVSSFWWADALGALAAANHTGYCRQTLVGGNYGLLNRTNFEPNPDYYVSKVFHTLMGDVVLQPAGFKDVSKGQLRVYANCNRNGSGITLLLINIAPATTFDVSLTMPATMEPREEYVFSATELSARYVSLNGDLLQVVQGRLPTLSPQQGTGDVIHVLPHTISYIVLPKYQASVCA